MVIPYMPATRGAPARHMPQSPGLAPGPHWGLLPLGAVDSLMAQSSKHYRTSPLKWHTELRIAGMRSLKRLRLWGTGKSQLHEWHVRCGKPAEVVGCPYTRFPVCHMCLCE